MKNLCTLNNLWIFLLLLFSTNLLYAQEKKTDSLNKKDIEIAADTSRKAKADSIKIKGDIKTTIQYFAQDSIISNMLNNTLYLYGNAKIIYGNIELTAHQIDIDQATNIVTARPRMDTTGRLRDKPVFKQSADQYEADSMRYNFKTQKGSIYGVVTKQNEGFITSKKSKRNEKGEMFAGGGRYTTCNLSHPHWYISAGKIKMIPEKQVITGPFHMVVGDVPTPLGFAFGMFPISETRKSGIIIPTYGEDADRGFFFRDGGYFWAVSPKLAATFLGEIYTNGSWGLSGNLQYNKRYRFAGNASVRSNTRIQGFEDEKTTTKTFWVNWSHAPQPRGRSIFSASVSFGSSKFNQLNDFNPNNFLANNFNSSVSYTTGFDIGETPVNIGMSIRHDQNSRTEAVNLTAPEFNLGVNRIYPFKKKGQSAKNFIQQINLSYNFFAFNKLSNQLITGSSLPFTVTNLPDSIRNEEGKAIIPQPTVIPFSFENLSEIAKYGQLGGIHTIPISTTIKLFKHLSFNPSISYLEAWYPRRLNYTWEDANKGVKVDTIRKFSRVYSYSFSASLTTRLYGIFNFDKKNQGKRLQAIRHTLIPTIGFGSSPDLSGESYGFYQYLQVDTLGNFNRISRYQGFEPGAPISTNQSGSLNFGVSNVFEAKLRGKTDTSEARKISLLENLSIATSYNLVADSFNLSPISIAARTRILNIVDFNFTGALDPYTYKITKQRLDGTIIEQKRINEFAWNKGRGIGQLNNFNVSMGVNFTPESFKKKTKDKVDEVRKKSIKSEFDTGLNEETNKQLQLIENNPDVYVDFDIPWTLRANYNISYNKVGFEKSNLTQTLNFGGSLSLTKTWKVGFSSGYDFQSKDISYTMLDINKDLHCWQMSFSWIPFGIRQSYTFDLSVKSSILSDLKISRRRSWYDRNVSF